MNNLLIIHSIFVLPSSIKITCFIMKNRAIGFFVLSLTLLTASDILAQNKGEEPVRLIKISTSFGEMIVKLYNETPAHRDNMVRLVNDGFYKDQLFHRVIKDFMIQGGDPNSTGAKPGEQLGNGGPGYTVQAEFNKTLIHKKGSLAAARMGDQVNPEKASSGSQFYLVQGRVFSQEELDIMAQRGMGEIQQGAAEIYKTIGGAPHLDGSYTVFGEIVEGFDVLDSIAGVQTDRYNRPLTDVVYSISLLR
jgi:peptidyl-prolyl cis-trans isomerase B (cyclophilin B)